MSIDKTLEKLISKLSNNNCLDTSITVYMNNENTTNYLEFDKSDYPLWSDNYIDITLIAGTKHYDFTIRTNNIKDVLNYENDELQDTYDIIFNDNSIIGFSF